MTFKSFLSVVVGATVSLFVSFLGFIAYSINELNVKLAVILERVTVHEKRIDALETYKNRSMMSKNHMRGEE